MKEFISSLKLPLNEPALFGKVFSATCQLRKSASANENSDPFKRAVAEEYDSLSKALDKTQIQDPASVRNILRSRRLANLLITDKGELNTVLLPKIIEYMGAHLYFLGPNRQYDAEKQAHILKVLKLLRDQPHLVRLLKMIGKPYSHRHADQIIRETLQLPDSTAVTDAHARRAVLSAWLCTLRQSIGSCFATAPAILIHNEQPEQFLKDVNELLNSGRLKRTYEGVEHSVPLSASWGAGDLRRILHVRPDASHEIWTSPGLIAAFIAGGLIESDLPREKRTAASKTYVSHALQAMQSHADIIVFSAEDLLRTVFMQHFGVSAQDLEDFLNRPRAMMQTSLMMHTSQGSAAQGKGDACAKFLVVYEKAANAFKALADNPLLKSWEFTLASFSEIKSGFTRWNLYASLGMNSQEKGGIGECAYLLIKTKFDEANEKTKNLQIEYEQVFTHVKYLETRIKNASETEAQWLKAEYQSKANEFYSLEEMRNRFNAVAARLGSLFGGLMKFYDELFPRYFQEVYDADMHDVSSGPYDDSPAGFRLLYKHGRMNTSQWTRIQNLSEFIDALVNFFVATETELSSSEEMEGLENIVSEIVTSLVNHVKTKEFMESAFSRMAAAHQSRVVKNPLENLDKIDKKPWVYTSGGTMDTLISCYYRRMEKPTMLSRWVENPLELLVFLTDSVKQIPYKDLDVFLQQPQKALLMQSPTHAFLLIPGMSTFKEAWQSEAYTYTWVRDKMIQPMKKFVEKQILDKEMMQTFIQLFKRKLPAHLHYYFEQLFSPLFGEMGAVEFREDVAGRLSREPAFRFRGHAVLSLDEIDHLLYVHLPLFPAAELQFRAKEIFALLPGLPEKSIAPILEAVIDHSLFSPILSAKNLKDVCKTVLLLLLERTALPVDYHRLIAQAAQQLGYSYPMPIIFADTNWVKDKFAFAVNPGTGELELWRVDLNGEGGYPMSSWAVWLDGSRTDIPWGIYTRMHEYTPTV